MNTLRTFFVIALAAVALWAQAPSAGDGRGKAKGGAGDAKGGRGAAGKAAAETKALAPPPDPQVLRFVRPYLYLITGEGGNSVFRATPEGVILVDTKLPKAGNYERLTELIRGIATKPVKFVVSTHNHPDHAGNNARFETAGAEIVSADRTLTPGGVEARVIHFAAGHTGSDCVAYFPADRVIAVGDLVNNVTNRAPAIDYAAGGSLTGTAQALDAIVGLTWDVAIPGHGDPVNRAFVEAYRTKLRTLLDRGREAVARGVAKEQLVSQIKTADLDWQLRLDAAQLDGFYGEMLAGR